MKYMLLIYGDEKALNQDELVHCYHESAEVAHRMAERGHFLAAAPLQATSTAASVQVRAGKRSVTDGPFAETHEQLGGYFLVEAKDLEEAIALAGELPGARMGTVEVRPIVEVPTLPGPN